MDSRIPRFAVVLMVAMGLASSAGRAGSQGLPAPPRVGGYVQLRETAQEGVGLTAALNRARFSIDGPLPSRFSYRLLVETEASTGRLTAAAVSLREAIIRWAPGSFAVTAGQFKTPFSREYLLPVPVLETPDFAAVVDSLSPKYDVGVMGEYAWGPWATAFLGVFNGEGQNATANRDSTVMWVGRLVVRPIAQLAVGGSATRDGPDSLRWGAEAQVEERGVIVRGEYIARHRRGRATDRDDAGWYVLGVYRVVPQAQLLVRQEDFLRPSIGLSRRVRGTTVGTIIEIVPNRVRLLVDGVRRTSGASHTRTTTFVAQAQVRF
ncbi:MAG TPA: porin [Candidatus Eisenbacteria bacterium]|nr:porin [Candidatus Eisenbacteria bacterium]